MDTKQAISRSTGDRKALHQIYFDTLMSMHRLLDERTNYDHLLPSREGEGEVL